MDVIKILLRYVLFNARKPFLQFNSTDGKDSK